MSEPTNWRAVVDTANPEHLELYVHWVHDLTAFKLHAKSDIAIVLAIIQQQRDDALDDSVRLHKEKVDQFEARLSVERDRDEAIAALREFSDRAQCGCTVLERHSGHRLGCDMASLMERADEVLAKHVTHHPSPITWVK